MTQISDAQRAFLEKPLARINLLEGSVRSGKTWISLVAWALFVASMPKDCEFLMVGKTLTTLRRNCLGLLSEMEPTFSFSTSAKKAFLYGHTVWLEGADNEKAENKIRGMTLAGAYFDEMTLIPPGFYYMALSRLSVHGAKLIATTNPDSPANYVYTDIVANPKIDKNIVKFKIEDNPFLDPEYVQNLKTEYTGVFYRRYFLGEWVVAEGLVYPMFNEQDNVVRTVERNYVEYCVSMDYGIQNPTAMLLWGRAADGWYLVDEYYHSGRTTNDQRTDEQYYAELQRLAAGRKLSCVIIDPSASSFITLVYQRGQISVRKADNTVLEGIQHVASASTRKDILINDCCKNTIREFGLYSWDNKTVSGHDTVVKENDHAMDAVRYFVQTKRLYRDTSGYVSPFERSKN